MIIFSIKIKVINFKKINNKYISINYILNKLLLLLIIIFPLYSSKIIIIKLRKINFYSEINITIKGSLYI